MHRRSEFSKLTKRLAFARSRGRCESNRVPSLASIGCNRMLRDGEINYHHIFAAALGGSDDVDNVAVLCRTCHALTTAHNEQPVIAQDKRVRDLAIGIRNAPSLPGNKSDPRRKKLNGLVVSRTTGLPWGFRR
jgi:HNH endonuclease